MIRKSMLALAAIATLGAAALAPTSASAWGFKHHHGWGHGSHGGWGFYGARVVDVGPDCYFVKRVNMSSTRCADGRFRAECYVAELDGNAQAESDGAQLVRGEIVARRYERFGNLGALFLSEAWKSLGANQPAGTFYLVRDRGVRCIAFPCPTHHEAKLNSSFSRNIAGINLEAAGLGENASVVNAAMTGPEGVIVAGQDSPVKGPGGRSFELKATQVYVRNKSDSGLGRPNTGSMKPCIKTGCSSQICADHNVVSTCEFRPEYECYQKATCERQSNGNCRTREWHPVR